MKKIFITTLALAAVWAHAQINLTPDSNFGNNGFVDLGSNLSGILSYQFLNDKMMIQNYDTADPNLTFSRITMLNSNGSLDSGFGTGGSFLIPVSYNGTSDPDFVHSISSSHILTISGKKYLHNGALDQTYGNNGQSPIHSQEIYRKELPNGKLLIRTTTHFYQYTATGNLDVNFGNNGSISTNNQLSNYNYPVFNYHETFVPQYPDNSIFEYDGNYSRFRKMNYNTGNFDVNFGVNGNAQYNVGNGNLIRFKVLNDNSVINYLFDGNNTASRFLTKTLSTGMLDTSFGNSGKVDLPNSINNIDMLYNQDFAVVNGTNYVIHVFDNSFPKKMYLANFKTNGLSNINGAGLLDTGITTGMVNPDDKIFIAVKDSFLYLIVNVNTVKRYVIAENFLSTNENKSDKPISFANPFSDELNLMTSEAIKKVEIFDSRGKSYFVVRSFKNQYFIINQRNLFY